MDITRIGRSSLSASRLAYGCWRIAGTWDPAEVTAASEAAGRRALLAAVEAGYTFFDHADIYCHGVGETIFGQFLREHPGLRERLVLATKCGIRRPDVPPGAPYRYDFSRAYIVESCRASLQRLGVEYVDVYQLHRPDFLMDPAEVAAAFDELHRAGQVKSFGVSNFAPSQITALQRAWSQPLVVNQIEISLLHLAPFADGTLDQCLAEGLTPMAWSPLAGGQLGDGARRVLPSQEAYRPDAVNAELDRLAKVHGTTRLAVALAWLLRHPAKIVPIVGSTDPARIREAVRATELALTREDWYRLFVIARGEPLP